MGTFRLPSTGGRPFPARCRFRANRDAPWRRIWEISAEAQRRSIAPPSAAPASRSRRGGSWFVLDLGLSLEARDDASADVYDTLLPRVSGFRERDDSLLGVVISHSHPGHYGLARKIRPEIPLRLALESRTHWALGVGRLLRRDPGNCPAFA